MGLYTIKNVYHIFLTGHFSNSEEEVKLFPCMSPQPHCADFSQGSKSSSNKKTTEHFPT